MQNPDPHYCEGQSPWQSITSRRREAPHINPLAPWGEGGGEGLSGQERPKQAALRAAPLSLALPPAGGGEQ
jgi:hypothetical protein